MTTSSQGTKSFQATKFRGRPRSESVDHEIHEAVLNAIAKAGIGAVSIEGVASVAGVSKASIYRRFDSKEELIVASLIHMREQNSSVPVEGTARERLIGLLEGLRLKMSGTREGRVMLAVLGAGQENPELATLVYERIVVSRREALRLLICDGISSGEFPESIDLNAAVPTLVGTMIYLGMWSGREPAGVATTDEIVDMILKK
jgi:AcrR family transcriptional regulator